MVDVRSEDLTGVELNGSDDDIDDEEEEEDSDEEEEEDSDEEEEEDSDEEDKSVDGSLTFLILLKFVDFDLCSEAFVGLAYDGSGI
ncbi:unnamed protein product [[Candida] boidinii]|uniref:Unnamed protein product n=1 Tax=Candida boidinii TaxID=5477 RepID=A0ACB5UAD6_CANBO|nr:unnamed protein product [[Candida] boidinii]